ncbi:hypothetical protein JCM10213_008706 [Rhodosporidiobolus nylandii]
MSSTARAAASTPGRAAGLSGPRSPTAGLPTPASGAGMRRTLSGASVSSSSSAGGLGAGLRRSTSTASSSTPSARGLQRRESEVSAVSSAAAVSDAEAFPEEDADEGEEDAPEQMSPSRISARSALSARREARQEQADEAAEKDPTSLQQDSGAARKLVEGSVPLRLYEETPSRLSKLLVIERRRAEDREKLCTSIG